MTDPVKLAEDFFSSSPGGADVSRLAVLIASVRNDALDEAANRAYRTMMGGGPEYAQPAQWVAADILDLRSKIDGERE